MSARLLGLGFGCDMGTPCRKLILLKLIDACDDDGSRIFPAVSTIARAAQCSTRQVQRELALMVDKGLLAIVRAGGAGPKSTREYAMDLTVLRRIEAAGWDRIGPENKGDTVSPLPETGDQKGDTGDTERVTPATDKGDSHCHPTPPYPSIDPSIEREARERVDDSGLEGSDGDGAERGVDPKAVERSFRLAFSRWPTFAVDGEPEARTAWQRLTPAERIAAADRIDDYRAASKQGGREKICAFSTYLRQKRWERLAPKTEEPARSTKPERPADYAPPLGPVWSALVHKLFLDGPEHPEHAPEPGGIWLRIHLQRAWPTIAQLWTEASLRRGVRLPARWHALKDAMEFVPVDTAMHEAWRQFYSARGLPPPPDPGGMGGMFYPKGGPDRLGDFEAAVAQGREQAAE